MYTYICTLQITHHLSKTDSHNRCRTLMYNNASNTDAGIQMTLVFKRRLLNAILTAKFHNVKFFTTRKKSFNFKPNCERESYKVMRFPVEHKHVYNYLKKVKFSHRIGYFKYYSKLPYLPNFFVFGQHFNRGC